MMESDIRAYSERKVESFVLLLLADYERFCDLYKDLVSYARITHKFNISKLLDFMNLADVILHKLMLISDEKIQSLIEEEVKKVRELRDKAAMSRRLDINAIQNLYTGITKLIASLGIAKIVIVLSDFEESVDKSLKRKYKI